MNAAPSMHREHADVSWQEQRLLGSRRARAVRRIMQRCALLPVVRWFCAPLIVHGRAHVPAEPVVFAANHASHADTVALLAALPRRARLRTSPAAAQDYFFGSRARALAVTLGLGAFPFPRHGSAGLRRAAALLDAGRNVVLFPEGTRSVDGEIAPFKPGIGILARAGVTVVPVGIAGTAEVMSKNARRPRRSPVAITFGAPLRPDGESVERATVVIERAVRACAARSSLARPAHPRSTRPRRPRPGRTLYARARALASSRAALVLVFCWGVAEALAWPIVPDLAIALLAAAAPRRFFTLAAAAIAGSLCGGALAWSIGPAFIDALPLVTDRMTEQTATWLHAEGAHAVARQPWSGIPFKVFAYQARAEHVALAPFLAQTLVARGLRFLAAGALFASIGLAGRRVAERLYGAFACTGIVLFFLALARVVTSWS